ncbi:prepilin peptidase-dependent protein [Salmonella enterica]
MILGRQCGFSLLETVVAMAISSLLLLATARFLPVLQQAVMQHTRLQTVEEELWQRLYMIAKHLQRAGYCNGSCSGEPLTLNAAGDCVIVQWDANSNGRWEPPGHNEAEQTGFRLRQGALETLRGATSCHGSGWEKITDPTQMIIRHFNISRKQLAGLKPHFIITLTAVATENANRETSAQLSVMGYNL